MPPVLHRHPEHRRHRGPGGAVPAADGARLPLSRPDRPSPGRLARLAPHLVFLIPEQLIAAGPFVIQAVAGTRRYRMPDFFYGGQALIEGVMMRGRSTAAMSVRMANGEIRTTSEALPRALMGGRWLKVPFVRGVLVLYETLILGTRMLMRSAALAAEGEDIEIGRGTLAVTMILSLGFAIGLFFVLPLLLSEAAEEAAGSDLLANLAEGGIRLVIFVIYLALIGMMSDVKRVFGYHGAEHKAISAHEADAPLEPESIDRFSTAHTRCGTTFVLIVVVISILFFSLIPRGDVPLPLLMLSRIALVPVVASVAYELVRFGARHYGNRLVRAIYSPGLWLQSLTTRPPDHEMLEVSITALERVLEEDRAPQGERAPA